MVTLRALRWPEDRPSLLALDVSFSSDYCYQLVQAERSFALEVIPLTPPLHKQYDVAHDLDTLPTYDFVVVAERMRRLVGVAALTVESWNRRANLRHCYVDQGCRGQGIGRALIEAAIAFAQTRHMRCVWLETQNINYPAIHFYERMGFVWCGLDTTLYDQPKTAPVEIALFFVRQLAS